MTQSQFNHAVKQIENKIKVGARVNEKALANKIMALHNEFESSNFGQVAY